MIDKNFLNDLEYQVTGACIEVHKTLGPGLLESIYHRCLIKELQIQGLRFTTERAIIINYKDLILDTELRADLYIENCLVLELKAVEKILPLHEAQLLTYMKILKATKGLLINFNCTNIIQNGKKPFVNDYFRNLLD
ncbi:MAG: GxxExxY protein [Pedobacter sp.]|nr:MAG: GxxExxY protein [Pedobacter sp.]